MTAPQATIHAIINPATGRKSVGVVADELRRQATERGLEISISYSSGPGDAVTLARAVAPDGGRVIAVGGDGTVSDVVTGIIGTDCAVGIVPTGSTNMIAKELGIPRRLQAAVHVALESTERRYIDVATLGSTTFLHIAGAGFDAAIMRDANPQTKRRFGWIAYLPSAARHLRYPIVDLRVTVDGVTETYPARTVLCAIGSSIIHPRFRIGENVDRSDGLIDVCIYNPPNLLATLGCAWWIARGTPGRSRWLHQLRGKKIRLEADGEIPFEVDGDPYGDLPIDIELLNDRVAIVIPTQ